MHLLTLPINCRRHRQRGRSAKAARAIWLALVVLVIVGLVTCSRTPAWSDEAPVSAESRVPSDADAAASGWVETIVEQAVDSVVLITVEGRDGQQVSLGTGFVVAADGLIATNLHVIGQARPITVRFRDGREFSVTEVYATDRQLDLAVIRIAADNLRPLPLADLSAGVKLGQPVIALGNPMGLRHSVVSGVLSGQREIDGRRMLQLAIPIEQGNSGGPLLDAQGHVLGIVTLKSALTANLGFAIEAAALQTVLDSPNPMLMSRWETMGALSEETWSIVFGARWQQRSGQILVSEMGSSFGGRALCLRKASPPPPPFELGTFVRLEDEAGAAGLVFASDGGDRHYGFYPSAGRLRLTRFDGPTVYSWQILAELESPHYHPGKWNHLKVRIEADRIVCFVNDHEVLQRRLQAVQGGQVGLAKFRDTQARFRQFAVAPQLDPSRLPEARLQPIRERLATAAVAEPASRELIEQLGADVRASRQVIEERIDSLKQEAAALERLAADLHVGATCRQLARLFEQPEAAISLSEAALLISRLDNPELDMAAYQEELVRLANEIRAEIPAETSDADKIVILNRYLFEQNGFHGSRTNYYQTANSYFDRVLDDREGLPITLSILYLELAQRLGLTMEGVGLPGHFVVRFLTVNGEHQLIDVFDGGATLSLEDARRISQQTSGTPFDEAYLRAVDKRTIVLRVLRNLQALAQRERDSEAVLRYLEAMVAVAPEDPAHRGMRAVVRFETGRRQAALADLDWFLENSPPGIDLEAIRSLKTRFLRSP